MDLTNLIKQSFRKWLEALHTTVKEIYIFYFNIRSIYLSIKFLHEHCHHDNAPLIFQLFLAYFFKTPLQSNIDPLSVIYNHTLRLGCLWDDGRMKEKGGVHFCHFFIETLYANFEHLCENWTLVGKNIKKLKTYMNYWKVLFLYPQIVHEYTKVRQPIRTIGIRTQHLIRCLFQTIDSRFKL